MRQLYFLLLFIFSISAHTQAQSLFGATLLGGINAAQVDGDNIKDFNKVGLNVGIRGDIYLSDKFQAGLELIYSERGSRSDILDVQNIGNPIKINLRYLDVPIILKYSDWYMPEDQYYRIGAIVGFAYGRLFQASSEGASFDDHVELVNKNDLSLILGANWMFNDRLGMTIRFNKGLTRFLNRDKHPIFERSMVSRWLTFRFEYSL